MSEGNKVSQNDGPQREWNGFPLLHPTLGYVSFSNCETGFPFYSDRDYKGSYTRLPMGV